MGTHRLSILHLSDLHAEAETPAQRALRSGRRMVFGKAWEENLDAILKHGPIDLVCFTGDLAFSGKAAEYEVVTPFLDALLKRVRVPRERFFVVPGNHDIDRDRAEGAWSELRGLGWDEGNALSAWMAGGRPPPRMNAEGRDAILDRQSAYRAWVKDTLGRPELVPGLDHPRLGYRVTLGDFSVPVHVIGLDSAWLAGRGGDAGNLRLTRHQVSALTEELTGFRLALMHHPLTDLADGTDCRRLLAERVNLLLRGHLHEPDLSFWSDPDQRALRELAAGCLYENDTYANACQRIDLTLADDGSLVRVEIRFRAWSARGAGFWHNDSSVYREAKDGYLVWPPSAVTASAAPPGPEAHPGVESVFVGREAELSRLEAILLPGSAPAPVAVSAVQGMPGVGKSYLVDRFAHLHKERFPGGYVKLALNPEDLRTDDDLGYELARKLDVPWGGAERWASLRARLIAPRTLVHIENADADHAAGATAKLAARLVGAALVISGRCQKIGHARGWQRLEMRPFDEATALAQLEQERGAPFRAAEREAMQRLARELAYLPLALHLAAGHLRERSVEGFLKLLREKRLALEPADLDDPMLRRAPERAVLRPTFELSLDLLRKKLGEKAESGMAGFAALGHAPPAGVGRSLGAAMAGLEDLAFEDLMVEATQLSLATRVTRPGDTGLAWSLHPLLAELLRQTLGSDARWQGGMRDWFLARLEEEGEDQGKRWGEVGQEEAALVAWLAQVPLDKASTVERAGREYAQRQGPFPAWVAFCERILAGTEDALTRSNALWTLSQMALRSGALDRARAAAEEKRRLDQARGEDHGAALAAGVLADIYQERGEYDEALRIRREEELPVYERLGDERSRAVTLGQMADICHERGEYDEALRIRREEQLPVYERLGDVRSRAVTLGKVADIYQERGEYDEALRILREEELPVYERLRDVRERAVTLGKLADIYQARGEYDEALRIRREEQLPVFERLGDVRELLVGRANLALLYLQRGRPEDRPTAAHLLRLALASADTLRIPEAQRIRRILQRYNLTDES